MPLPNCLHHNYNLLYTNAYKFICIRYGGEGALGGLPSVIPCLVSTKSYQCPLTYFQLSSTVFRTPLRIEIFYPSGSYFRGNNE